MESAQGDAHDSARADLADLEADAHRQHWPEVELLAAAGQALCSVLRPRDPAALERELHDLVARAQALGVPALLGLALGLRAVGAAGRQDSATLLADAGRAVALADDEDAPAVDRCMVLVVCAAAYNSLSLWELVDELYDRATALAPACEEPLQEPAVAVNRVLIRLEWATALFELDRQREALDQLHRATEAVQLALGTENLPRLWRLDVQVCDDLLRFVLQAHDEFDGDREPSSRDAQLAVLDGHRDALVTAGDVEVLPLLDAFVALSLLRVGLRRRALTLVGRPAPTSSSSGARTFRAWVRARVLEGGDPDEALSAQQEYGVLVSQLRWSARQGVLAAARSKIAGERLSVEHATLARDVLLDPLTGLSNRRSFDDWLVRVPVRERTTALLLIDLDSFKRVNDVYGHAVGDDVLRRVGLLIAAHVRPGDMALRLGGDEFAVVLEEDHERSPGQSRGDLEAMRRTALGRAQALREAVAVTDWNRLAGGLSVRVSVGVAVSTLGPQRPDAADRLYRTADADLYAGKSRPDGRRTASVGGLVATD
jgi:diguanylate cyclase (GGDEF)-like protein